MFSVERSARRMAHAKQSPAPKEATGVLVLADGTAIWGRGFGAEGEAVGEACFNTALTGHQAAMTDPSAARAHDAASGGGGFGAEGEAVGEACFNTAMTGYQEVMTDPSCARQIVAFTFPHIGNVGANYEDLEAGNPWGLELG